MSEARSLSAAEVAAAVEAIANDDRCGVPAIGAGRTGDRDAGHQFVVGERGRAEPGDELTEADSLSSVL